MSTWVVVADEGLARILERPTAGGDLVQIDQLTDAAARADAADLRRDAHGQRGGGDPRMGGNITASAGEDELHREAEGFARRVASHLAEALQKRRYDELHVVAAPRFLGLLRKALDQQVSERVVGEQNKDLIHCDARQLTQRLFPRRTSDIEEPND